MPLGRDRRTRREMHDLGQVAHDRADRRQILRRIVRGHPQDEDEILREDEGPDEEDEDKVVGTEETYSRCEALGLFGKTAAATVLALGAKALGAGALVITLGNLGDVAPPATQAEAKTKGKATKVPTK